MLMGVCMLVHVCVCVHACVRACVHSHACVCVCSTTVTVCCSSIGDFSYPIRQLEWKNWSATVNADHTIDMVDISNESAEHLEFPERVVRASLGWGHLIVTTPTQCYIYK